MRVFVINKINENFRQPTALINWSIAPTDSTEHENVLGCIQGSGNWIQIFSQTIEPA